MDPKTLELLEYKKVVEMAAREASTEPGMARISSYLPSTVNEARARQALAREIMEVLVKVPAPSLGRVRDVSGQVMRAGRHMPLTPADLRAVLDLLEALDILSRWLKDNASDYPGLSGVRNRIPDLSGLSRRLSSVVDEAGEIRDAASPALQSIRRSIREYQDRIRRRAEELARRRDIAPLLQDPIVTTRSGRYVLPVKQEYASKVPGIVHDESASGQTLFIEPAELVEMGNNLRRLELKERDEIERILLECSDAIGAREDDILAGQDGLASFDAALAAARLCYRWKGVFPKIVDEHVIDLKRAWHPLLKGTPVPMDLCLDESGVRTVIITGPNMGGKTVALKTCGLLTALALAGFPCPCSPETRIGAIDDVLCDIGDEQSIEENLSTFSAHISNVVRIIEKASPGKLVLIDELCAGTDPKEGAALALAILNKLHSLGALIMITSHYAEMKVLAHDSPAMENASVEWDAVRMVPTYRLVVGRPGRSNAFPVARKLGLDERIIQDARSRMSEEFVKLEDVIGNMERATQSLREQEERATVERAHAERLRLEYERKLKELEDARRKVLEEARREASAIVARARVQFEAALKEAKALTRERGSASEFADKISSIRKSLSASDFEIRKDSVPAGVKLSPDKIVPGLEVMVKGFETPGVVVEHPSGDSKVLVRIGSFTMRVPVEDVYESAELKKAESVPAQGIFGTGSRVPLEIDLRGMTGEEAILSLDKYLDDAFLAGLPQVRIIHGKGTGALRKAVLSYLEQNNKYIAGYRPGEPSEGGTGVTVAKIRT